MPPLRSLALALALVAGSAYAQLPNSARELHQYDLLDVAWEVTLNPDTALLVGSVTNTVRVSTNGGRLIFDAVGLRVRRAFVNGEAAQTRTNGKVIEVVSPRPLLAKEKVAVQIDYAGRPEAGLYHVPGNRAFPAVTDVFYTQGEMEDTRYWLPTYDYPNDKATSQGTVRVPTGWQVLSNGRLVSQQRLDGYDVFRWKMDQPHVTYLISLVAGTFSWVPDGTKPVETSIFVPKFLESWGKHAFGGTDRMVQIYSKLTGLTYPYAKYSQAAVPDFMFGGMENITATTNTINAIFPPSVGTARDASGLVAHELAHQWFGDTVTTPEWKHIWVNEGWATFMPLFVERELKGQDAFAMSRLGVIEGALGAMMGAPNRAMVHDTYEEPMDLFDGFAYAGGAARMVMLMHYLGEPTFWKATKSYLNRSKFQNVDTERFFAEFNRATKKNLDFFRKQWFYTPSGAPGLTVKRSGSEVVLESSALFQSMPIDVWMIDAEGKVEKTRVTPSSTTTVIPNVQGRRVLVDPEVWALAVVSYDMGYKRADWEALWKAAPNAAQRSRLSGSLLATLDGAGKTALFAAETYGPLKQTLLASVTDRAVVMEALQNSDPNMALAALSQLGKFKSAETMQVAESVFKNAANEEVRNRAAMAWMDLSPGIEVAKSMLGVNSYNESIRVHALQTLASRAPDVAREQALSWLANPKNEALRVASISVLGQVKDKPGERRVVNAILPILRERSNGALSAAISAADAIGDPAFAFPLYLRRDHSLHFTRREIRGVLARLQRRMKR